MSPVGAKSLEVLENLDSRLDSAADEPGSSPEPRREPPSSGVYAKTLYDSVRDPIRIPPNPVPAFDELPSLDDELPLGSSVARNDATRIDFDSVLVRVSTVPPAPSLAAYAVPEAPAPSIGEASRAVPSILPPASPASAPRRRTLMLGLVLVLSGVGVSTAAYRFGPSLLVASTPVSEPGTSTVASVPPVSSEAPSAAPAPVSEEEATMVFGIDDLVSPASASATARPAAIGAVPAPAAASGADAAPSTEAAPVEPALATPAIEAGAAAIAAAPAVEANGEVPAEAVAAAEPVAPAPEPTPEQHMDSLLANAVSSTTGEAIRSLAPESRSNGTAGLPAQPARSEVVAAMRAVAGAVDACTGTAGTATLRITFASDGSVRSASAAAPFAGTGEGACMAQAVEGARVSPFARPTFTVSYPFTVR